MGARPVEVAVLRAEVEAGVALQRGRGRQVVGLVVVLRRGRLLPGPAVADTLDTGRYGPFGHVARGT